MSSVISISDVILPHQVRKDGSYMVKFRISYNRKSAYIKTPHIASKKQLGKNFNLLDPFLLTQVTEDKLKLQREISSKHSFYAAMDVKDICTVLYDFLYGVPVDEKLKYVPFARKIIERKKSVSGGNWRNYELSLHKLIVFVGHERFTFNDITLVFLRDYDRYLEGTGVGPRGRNLYLSNLRATLNEAKLEFNDEDRGIILIPGSPFNRFKMPRSLEVSNAALTIEQIKLIRDVELTTETEIMARDVFMLSFYLVGMNSVDIYELPKIGSDRITYCRSKTANRRTDQAQISLKIEPEAASIIGKYVSLNERYAFCFSDKYSNSNNFNMYINRYLKRVGAKVGIADLIFYSARHSWATIFVNECGGSESEAAFCLNHVSEHKVTSRYIKKDFTRIDVANRKVLDKLL